MKASFAGNSKAPAGARSFVTRELHAAFPDGPGLWAADVVLVVSELVTNSVRAGASQIEVDLTAHGDRVDVRVADDAPGWPTPRNAATEDLNGRGLQIVDELAHRWTTSPGNPGKSVTATWFRQRVQ